MESWQKQSQERSGINAYAVAGHKPLTYNWVLFEWDEAKSETNLSQRGFDFAHAALIFGERDAYREAFE